VPKVIRANGATKLSYQIAQLLF